MATFAEIFGPKGFDCRTVDPADDFLKPGDYTVQIIESEVRQNKKQNGHYLALILQIIQEGENKGRKIYDYINIDNPKETTVRIAQKSLSALGRSTNIWDIQDPRQLLNQIVVAVVTKTDTGNNVRTYKPVSEMQSATAGSTPAAPAPVLTVVAPQVAPQTSTSGYMVPVTVPPPASAAPVYQQPQQQVAPVAPVAPMAPAVAPVAPPAPAVPPSDVTARVAPPAVTSVPVWQQPQ